ncbi:alpha-1,2-fucosyltransferase [Flavobacterium sp. ACN6]|uniref:alpha-1,2-fucosyltransferase n=1 Tax=Flavobacterium sp. ACN6 TaxID=1920426 RepID=UPI0015531EA7|nr:alpha-1,2-fucosyltransferase [Flavobacterium sp. ACN6]
MITFSKLGTKGNLGNQLFQIASTIGLAEKYGHKYGFPNWSYSKYFRNQIPFLHNDHSFEIVREKEFNYYEWNLENGNYDIVGWLQSEKYFNIEKTKEIFQFEDFKNDVYLKYNFLFSKKTILVSVRRGDFVKNPHFYQLSHSYYLKAIIENFPDWKERNIIFTSDDIAYCKYHFSFLKNSHFLDSLSAIEQLAFGTKCDDYVISNSTFSWWIAWLGEKENSKVIRPIKNLRGDFAKINNDVDYFPKRWISFDDKNYNLRNEYWWFRIKGFVYEFLVGSQIKFRKRKNKIKKKIKKYILK